MLSDIFISIVTINFNNYLGLKRTVESVLNQSFKNFEFIVIDGGSNDGSVEYLNSVGQNLFCWISERDNGIYEAMNKGLVRVKGKYVLFLNSGDWFVDNVILEKISTHFYLNYDLLFFSLKYGIHVKGCNSDIGFYNSLFIGKTMPHQSTFFKSALIKKVQGYNHYFKIAGDHHLYAKLYKKSDINLYCSPIIITEMTPGGIGSILTMRHLFERLYVEIFYIRNIKTLKFLLKSIFIYFIKMFRY